MEIEKNINDYESDYEKKSIFDIEQIGLIIAQLMTKCTEKSYNLRTVQYSKNDRDNYGWNVEKNLYITAIIQDEAYKTKYSDFDGIFGNEMWTMKQAGKILLLNSYTFNPAILKNDRELSQIQFYHFSSHDRYLNDNVSDSLYNVGFSFVLEFIDLVITYRLQNNIENITNEELSKLLEQFLIQNETQIKLNLDKMEKESQEKVLQMTLKSDVVQE